MSDVLLLTDKYKLFNKKDAIHWVQAKNRHITCVAEIIKSKKDEMCQNLEPLVYIEVIMSVEAVP